MDDLDQIKQLAGLNGNLGRLAEYTGYDSPTRLEGSNPSITAIKTTTTSNPALQSGLNFGSAYHT